MRGFCRAIVERAIELVDGVRAEGVAHLGAVERDARDAAVLRHVRGDVGVGLGAGCRHPFVLVEELGNAHRASLRRALDRRVVTRPDADPGAAVAWSGDLDPAHSRRRRAAAALLLSLAACSSTPVRRRAVGVRRFAPPPRSTARAPASRSSSTRAPSRSTTTPPGQCIETDGAIAASDALAEAGVTTEGTDAVRRPGRLPRQRRARRGRRPAPPRTARDYFETCESMPAAFAYWSLWVQPAGRRVGLRAPRACRRCSCSPARAWRCSSL